MIGAKQFEVNYKQFTAGMTTTDFTSDGGFGPSSVNINPLSQVGVMRATATPTDASTNLAGNIIASCEDSRSSSFADRLFVDGSANYYTLSSGTLTKQKTGTATTHYIYGTTDMVSFLGKTYTSLDNDLSQWDVAGNTLDESYWVTTKAQSSLSSSDRHPLLVYEGNLFIADANQLHTLNSSLTAAAGVLVLNTNERIVALGIDPSTGLMLLSVTVGPNYSDGINNKSFVYLYDGYSSKPRRKLPVDEMITAFYNVGGTVFVGFGRRLGYWNGNGVSFLRNLDNTTAGTATDLPYRHHFAHIGNTLFVVNGQNVLAYGELQQGGRKVFWYPYQQTSGTHIGAICNVNNTTLGVAYATNKLYLADLTSTSTGSGYFYLNNVNFERPIKLHMVRVVTTGVSATGAAGANSTIAIANERNQTKNPTNNSFYTTTTKYVYDFQFGGEIIQTLQPYFALGDGFGIIRIIFYFDPYE